MRFNCGPTLEERARLSLHNKILNLRDWHKKFAWLPIRVDDNTCVWLEYVDRRYPNASKIFGLMRISKGCPIYRFRK